jgi:signal transduction histidine kinase/tetratricopeptide (TPR) repeat protein
MDFKDADDEVQKFQQYLYPNEAFITPDCSRRMHSLLANFFFSSSHTDSAKHHFEKAILYSEQCKNDTAGIFAMLDYARFLSSVQPDEFVKHIHAIYSKLYAVSKRYKYTSFLGQEAMLSDSIVIMQTNTDSLSASIIKDMPNNIKYLWRQYYSLYGSALIFSTNVSLAEKYLKLSLFFDRNNPTDDWESISLSNLGLLSQNAGNHIKAVEYFLSAIEKNKELHEEFPQINTLLNISYSYRMIKRYAVAKQYTNDAIAIAEKLKLKKMLCRILSAHASVFIEEGNVNEAEKYLLQSIALSHSIKNKADLCYSMRKLANMLIEYTPRLKEGKMYIDSSAYYAKEIGDNSFMYYINFTQANYFYKTGDYNKAAQLVQSSYKTSIDYNDKEIALVSLDLLHKVFEKLNNSSKALDYYRQYIQLKDSVSGKEMHQALSDIQEKYESREKQLSIEKLEKEKVKRNLQNKILFGALSGLVLLSGLFFYFNRKLNKQKLKLQTTNASLAELTASQNRLFGIISHDLKGMVVPFYRAGKILTNYIDKKNMQDAKIFSGKLEENASRLSDTLHNLLFWSLQQMKGLGINKEVLPVNETINHVVSHYTGAIEIKNVSVINNVSLHENLLTDKEAFQVIIRNIFSNALKFTENNSIIFSSTDTTTHYSITIEDKGAGMAQQQIDKLFGFEDKKIATGTQGETGSGLGLVVVKKMAAMLNANLDIISELGLGTAIRIIFKKNV